MPPGFLEYIVDNHKLKFEDVATDALAFVLQNSAQACAALRRLLNTQGKDFLPEQFYIEIRRSIKDGGVPDLTVRSTHGDILAIIESKFRAALTDHQQQTYPQYLIDHCPPNMCAILVFLVPQSRANYYIDKFKGECGDIAAKIWFHNQTGDLESKHRLCVRVITWTQVLSELRKDPVISSDFDLFLTDLERMCKVAEPDPFESLKDDELSNIQEMRSPFAVRARNFMALASDIAKESFGEAQEDYAKYGKAWGEMWSGVYGQLGKYKAWIGLDAATWSEKGHSPIWLIFNNQPQLSQLVSRLHHSSLQKGIDYFVRPDGKRIDIPIPLCSGSREEVLEACRKYILIIKNLVDSETLQA